MTKKIFLFFCGFIIVESPTYVSRVETYMRVCEKIRSVVCERRGEELVSDGNE